MSTSTGVVDVIQEMGPVRFREFLFNHPTIACFFDRVGDTTTLVDSLATLPSGASRDWVVKRQEYLHEVVDRNLAVAIDRGPLVMEDLIEGLKAAHEEVVEFSERTRPLDYLGRENTAFPDGCGYQLMQLMNILKQMPPLDEGAISAMRQESPDWKVVVPGSDGWMKSMREFHRNNPE